MLVGQLPVFFKNPTQQSADQICQVANMSSTTFKIIWNSRKRYLDRPTGEQQYVANTAY